MALRSTPSWPAKARRIASGNSSHRRVEPSRSVNKNVTVPDGNSATPTPSTERADRQVNQPNRTRVTDLENAHRPLVSGGSGTSRDLAIGPRGRMDDRIGLGEGMG